MEISDKVKLAAQNVLDLQLPSARYWVREQYESYGRRCLWQATDNAVSDSELRDELRRALVNVITEQYSDRLQGMTPLMPWEAKTLTSLMRQRITTFNDDADTRYADIRRVLEKVIAG